MTAEQGAGARFAFQRDFSRRDGTGAGPNGSCAGETKTLQGVSLQERREMVGARGQREKKERRVWGETGRGKEEEKKKVGVCFKIRVRYR